MPAATRRIAQFRIFPGDGADIDLFYWTEKVNHEQKMFTRVRTRQAESVRHAAFRCRTLKSREWTRGVEKRLWMESEGWPVFGGDFLGIKVKEAGGGGIKNRVPVNQMNWGMLRAQVADWDEE